MGKVVELFEKVNEPIKKNMHFPALYEIVSVIDNYKDSKDIFLTVQVKGTAKTFVKSVKELYQKIWLDEFSREDVAYIGFLYAAETSENLPLLDYFPRKKTTVTKSVAILGMLFVSFLILSNMTAFKVVEFHLANFFFMKLKDPLSISFPAALIFFPLTYFFDDTLTEVYGFKISRLVIWGGLFCSTLFTLCAWGSVYLPASPIWDASTLHGQKAYSLIFEGSARIFIASILAYFCGEFLNSVILAKLKILTSGKYFFIRVIGSTAIGVGIDSVIFCNIAFWNTLPHSLIFEIIIVQYLFKLTYEIIMLPGTYYLTRFLKNLDQVDYYDFRTKFNPFSMSLSD